MAQTTASAASVSASAAQSTANTADSKAGTAKSVTDKIHISGIQELTISSGSSDTYGLPSGGWYYVIYIGNLGYNQCIQIAIGYFGTSKRYTRTFAGGQCTNAWIEF